jgi:hypothetical protein
MSELAPKMSTYISNPQAAGLPGIEFLLKTKPFPESSEFLPARIAFAESLPRHAYVLGEVETPSVVQDHPVQFFQKGEEFFLDFKVDG